jgi:arylsulfatase A-like enzyme
MYFVKEKYNNNSDKTTIDILFPQEADEQGIEDENYYKETSASETSVKIFLSENDAINYAAEKLADEAAEKAWDKFCESFSKKSDEYFDRYDSHEEAEKDYKEDYKEKYIGKYVDEARSKLAEKRNIYGEPKLSELQVLAAEQKRIDDERKRINDEKKRAKLTENTAVIATSSVPPQSQVPPKKHKRKYAKQFGCGCLTTIFISLVIMILIAIFAPDETEPDEPPPASTTPRTTATTIAPSTHAPDDFSDILAD